MKLSAPLAYASMQAVVRELILAVKVWAKAAKFRAGAPGPTGTLEYTRFFVYTFTKYMSEK